MAPPSRSLARPDPKPVVIVAITSGCAKRRGVYSTHVNSRDLVREVEAAGWKLDRTRGSHHVYNHPQLPGVLVIPHPRKDLGKGLVSAIRKQAGLKE